MTQTSLNRFIYVPKPQTLNCIIKAFLLTSTAQEQLPNNVVASLIVMDNTKSCLCFTLNNTMVSLNAQYICTH